MVLPLAQLVIMILSRHGQRPRSTTVYLYERGTAREPAPAVQCARDTKHLVRRFCIATRRLAASRKSVYAGSL